MIQIASDLLNLGETVADVIENRSMLAGDDIVLMFDENNTLTIKGLTDETLLLNDMVIV